MPKKRKRRLLSVLGELEFEEAPTQKDKVLPCRYCGIELPHHRSLDLWVALKHDAPCGFPCLGGGIAVGQMGEMHSELCPRCTKRK